MASGGHAGRCHPEGIHSHVGAQRGEVQRESPCLQVRSPSLVGVYQTPQNLADVHMTIHMDTAQVLG